MADDISPVICFQHCEDVNIICLKLPQDCPICGISVWNTAMRIPPFRIPSPFTHSHQSPYSLVIIPTKGNFLENYRKGDNLHVGLTDSRGVVYDFTLNGVSRSLDGWDQCIALEIIPTMKPQVLALWNAKLQEFVALDKWEHKRYNEDTNNCYDFALEFIKFMELNGSLSVDDRKSFCESILLPQTKRAAQYITSYRRLLDEQVVIQYPENSTTL